MSTDFHEISVPTLVIQGDKDAFGADRCNRKKVPRADPRARLKIYAGAPPGHFVRHSDRLKADLLEYVKSAAALPKTGLFPFVQRLTVPRNVQRENVVPSCMGSQEQLVYESPSKRRRAQSSEGDIPKSHRGGWIALAILCAIGAAAVTRRLIALGTVPLTNPTDLAALDAHFREKTASVLLHILPSLMFVWLAPLQFITSLRKRWPRLHRWIGRSIMSLGVVLGISALWLSAHPVGGIVESTAAIFFGCFFLFSLAKAWWHIRNRRVGLHREWVTRMTAIAAGVAMARPIIGVFFATRPLTGLTPEQFFGPAMWLGLTATYIAGEIWIRHIRSESMPS